MNFKILNLPKSQVEITITVPEEKMKEFRKHACEEISKEVKIKGFRPGHVPPEVLEKHVEKKHIDAHSTELAIQRSYAEIVVKEKIQVISPPKVEIKREWKSSVLIGAENSGDNVLEFVATVATLPEVEITDHASIKVKKEEEKVTDKDIDEVIENLVNQSTTYKQADREVRKNDKVEVDFEGFDEKDKPVPNTKSENHPLIVGEGSLIPGFEDNLIGLKKDEKKEFKLKFPKDYHNKDFQKKKVKFKVQIKKIEEPIKPEVNEEFIEKLTGRKQNKEDFRKEVEKNLKARKEQEARMKQEDKYIEELVKKTKVDIPEILMEEEVESMIGEQKQRIESYGLKFENYLEQMKMTPEDLKKKFTLQAGKRVAARLAILKLLKVEDIKVSDEELQKELDLLKAAYPEADHKKVDEEFEKGKLKMQFANRIALRKLFEKVLPE